LHVVSRADARCRLEGRGLLERSARPSRCNYCIFRNDGQPILLLLVCIIILLLVPRRRRLLPSFQRLDCVTGPGVFPGVDSRRTSDSSRSRCVRARRRIVPSVRRRHRRHRRRRWRRWRRQRHHRRSMRNRSSRHSDGRRGCRRSRWWHSSSAPPRPRCLFTLEHDTLPPLTRAGGRRRRCTSRGISALPPQ